MLRIAFLYYAISCLSVIVLLLLYVDSNLELKCHFFVGLVSKNADFTSCVDSMTLALLSLISLYLNSDCFRMLRMCHKDNVSLCVITIAVSLGIPLYKCYGCFYT